VLLKVGTPVEASAEKALLQLEISIEITELQSFSGTEFLHKQQTNIYLMLMVLSQ